MDNPYAPYMKKLNQHRKYLNKQQYRTLKGQILSGNGQGAMKGLDVLIARRMRKSV